MRNVNSACDLHIKTSINSFIQESAGHTRLDTSSHVHNHFDRHNECRPTNAMLTLHIYQSPVHIYSYPIMQQRTKA